MIFVTFVAILVILIALPHMTPQDIIVCILAFMPTGWGMLQVNSRCTFSYIIYEHHFRGGLVYCSIIFLFILYICEHLERQNPIGGLYSYISSIGKMLDIKTHKLYFRKCRLHIKLWKYLCIILL